MSDCVLFCLSHYTWVTFMHSSLIFTAIQRKKENSEHTELDRNRRGIQFLSIVQIEFKQELPINILVSTLF